VSLGDRFDLRGAHVSGSAVGSHSGVCHQSEPLGRSVASRPRL